MVLFSMAPPWPKIATQILAITSALQTARRRWERRDTSFLRAGLGGYSYSIGQNTVTWSHIAAREAGKCSFRDCPISEQKFGISTVKKEGDQSCREGAAGVFTQAVTIEPNYKGISV